MKKYICVHGHFYQPPRENAWLETIESQESAKPYHDWNERITEECYGPNAVARILNDEGKIVDIVNNYANISFNFGPTLLSWMEQNRPQIYQLILDADKKSMENFGGHGSALAQVYNHIIMPLANKRDKITQVKWGIADFESRFGRHPEGIWLAETAVDTETLEVLADHDIAFTILAPRQAKHFRKKGESTWTKGIDTRRPYLCRLPSGKSIALFFYDGERSQDVAFKGILKDGKQFASNLLHGFTNQEEPQLVHIATDGESYGHHHRRGEMALAYCLRYLEENSKVKITNYGQFLSMYPLEYEVEIHENSSWSCVHGVERWRNDCGCNSGTPNWNQLWRKPLREALDWLSGNLAGNYEQEMYRYSKDPWGMRDRYISLILKRDKAKTIEFLNEEIPDLPAAEYTHVIRLLEMQRNALLMFTSCGWFFDEISGIETVQILQYANRAIQLAEVELGIYLDQEFQRKLELAPSNLPQYQNGGDVYEKLVKPSRLTLTQIGMQYAVSSLFADDPGTIQVFNYECRSDQFRRFTQGNQKLALGQTTINSRVTLSKKNFSFMVLYLGQHHIIGKAFDNLPPEEYEVYADQLVEHFNNSNVSAIIEMFRDFPRHRSFSFFDMFRDEQIKMLEGILDVNVAQAASSYEKINERNYNLLNVMRTSGISAPKLLMSNLEQVIKNDLRKVFTVQKKRIQVIELRRIIREMEKWDIRPERTEFDYLCTSRLNSLMGQFPLDGKEDLLQNIQRTLELLRRIPVEPELNEIQEMVFTWLQDPKFMEQDELRESLISFGKFINLETSVILSRKTKNEVGALN